MLDNKITISELIEHLKVFDPEAKLTFGNDDKLTFYRTKRKGERLVQIEFNEVVLATDTNKEESN